MTNIFPDIDTPALIIEKSILDRNIKNMQRIANKYNVKLRPHIKTHKMPFLAKEQLNAGAVGIACAKLSEAHIFADSGIRDIQIANIIVGDIKFNNLLGLQNKVEKLSCCVDTLENATPLAGFLMSKGRRMDVLIIIDCGYGRCGMNEYERILDLANFVQNHHNLNLLGITTHAGQAYGTASKGIRKQIAIHEGEFMVNLANKLRNDRISIKEVSVGSNPTARLSVSIPGITEIRTGNYIFNDMIQVALGVVVIEDCALSILSQVISAPSSNRVIIDAGSKTLSSDKGAHGNENLSGYGKIIAKKAELIRLSEEHGIILHHGEKFRVGERFRIIPNHACSTVNMHAKAYLVDGERVIQEINIEARGMLS